MATPRIRADRPLTNAERQARVRERYRTMRVALVMIRDAVSTVSQARRVAIAALEEPADDSVEVGR